MKTLQSRGFTLIEIVMVIILVAILAAVAIPQFIDFRKDAKDSATKGALGGLRSGVGVMVSAIALKENPTTSPAVYPTLAELSGNLMLAAAPAGHVVLAGTAIMDKSSGIPSNPWTNTNTVNDCSALAKGGLLVAPADSGWCYKPSTGETWANSDLNGGPTTENNF